MISIENVELCVGIDPSDSAMKAWGMQQSADSIREFSERILEAVLMADVRIVKPQSAFFEALGATGIHCLESVIHQARAKGLKVILDAKRGDIGSTVAGYARCYFGPAAPMAVDGLTVSPFLGIGALTPLLDAAEHASATAFVLLATSNHEASILQRATLTDGRDFSELLAEQISRARRTRREETIGAVIGSTVDPQYVSRLVRTLGGGPVLMPGIGPQGGSLDSVEAAIDSGAKPIVSVSRAVASAGPRTEAMISAIADVREQLASI